MPGWQPLHENHAIDVMAAVVLFAEPIPQVALRRMLRAAEEAAFGAGLKSRHSTRATQLVVSPQEVPSTAAGAQEGLLFNALFEGEDGTPIPGRVAEQLRVDAVSIQYRTWRYVSWAWASQRMQSLMSPALELARDVTFFSAVRLEYLDRFWFDGEPRDALTSDLLRVDCSQLAPHIFNERDLWHVHTGAFIRPDPVKRLQLIHVDALNASPQTDQTGNPVRRWVHITTALEDRFPADPDEDPRERPGFPFEVFNGMHSELKALLSTIITSKLAARIYLGGPDT
jgi:hypothetical protein